MRRMLPGALSSSVSRKSRRLCAGRFGDSVLFCAFVIPVPCGSDARSSVAADDLVEHPVVEGVAQRLHVRELAREADGQAQPFLLLLNRLVVLGHDGVDAAIVVGGLLLEVGTLGLLP